LLGPAIEMLEKVYPEIDGHKQNAQALEKQLGQCMQNFETQLEHNKNLQKDMDAELEGNLYLRELYGARESETFFDFIERLAKERFVYLPDTKNHGPENCPTFYDGCHCTVEVLDHNIDRAEMAEQKLAETIKELVLVKSQLSKVMEFEHTLSCGHTYQLRHTACPTCMEELKQENKGFKKKLLGAMAEEFQGLVGPCKCGLYDEIGEGAPGHTKDACPPPPVEAHTAGSHECEALPPHTMCWEDGSGMVRWKNEKGAADVPG